jgi:hypothetical protein
MTTEEHQKSYSRESLTFEVQPLRGYRRWNVSSDDHLTLTPIVNLTPLVNVTVKNVWLPGWNTADHVRRWWTDGIEDCTGVASKDCQCGFYACAPASAFQIRTRWAVAGIIEGRGLCSWGDRGFRASEARVVALISQGIERIESVHYGDDVDQFGMPVGLCMPPSWEQMERLSDRYDVPIYGTLAEAEAAFPLTPKKGDVAA